MSAPVSLSLSLSLSTFANTVWIQIRPEWYSGNLKMCACGGKIRKALILWNVRLCHTKADAHDKFGFWVLIGSSCNKIDWLTQTLRFDIIRNKAKTKDSCANTVQSLSLSLSLSTFTTCYQSLQFRSRRSSGVPDQGQTCIPSYNLVRLCVRWSPHAERNISDMYLLSDACHGRIQRGDKGSGSPEKSQKYRVS